MAKPKPRRLTLPPAARTASVEKHVGALRTLIHRFLILKANSIATTAEELYARATKKVAVGFGAPPLAKGSGGIDRFLNGVGLNDWGELSGEVRPSLVAAYLEGAKTASKAIDKSGVVGPPDVWKHAKTGEPIAGQTFHGSDANLTRLKVTDSETGRGIYTTDNWTVAEEYGSNLYGADVRLSNPLVYDAGGKSWAETPIKQLTAQATAEGRDGLIIQNVRDAKYSSGGAGTTVVAFDPDSVELAVKINTQTFEETPIKPDASLSLSPESSEFFDFLNKEALDYAKQRGAELVGMRYNRNGDLVPNENAEWAINESTRDGLRDLIAKAFDEGLSPSQLADAIRDAYEFSEARADMIARTELAFAHTQGELDSMRASGAVTGKSLLLSDGHDIDDECNDAADEGVVDLDADIDPPLHPNCECTLVYEVAEEESEAA